MTEVDVEPVMPENPGESLETEQSQTNVEDNAIIAGASPVARPHSRGSVSPGKVKSFFLSKLMKKLI